MRGFDDFRFWYVVWFWEEIIFGNYCYIVVYIYRVMVEFEELVLGWVKCNMGYKFVWEELGGFVGDFGIFVFIVFVLVFVNGFDFGIILVFIGVYNVVIG